MADVRLFGYTTDHHTGWTHGVSGHSPRTLNVFRGTKEGASSAYGKRRFLHQAEQFNQKGARSTHSFEGIRIFPTPGGRRVALASFSFVTSGLASGPPWSKVTSESWRDIRGVFTDPGSGRPLNWAGLDPHIPWRGGGWVSVL